jgi:hypothetical protein
MGETEMAIDLNGVRVVINGAGQRSALRLRVE